VARNVPDQYVRNRYVEDAPQIHESAFIADSVDLIGGITIGELASVWYQTVIRADDEPITIGKGTNVQDGCIVHIDPGNPTVLGDYVTIGHGAIVHGAVIEDDVMVAIGATVLTGARVGTGSIIGAGALVTEGAEIPPHSLVVGVPGKVIRTVSDEQASRIRGTAETYIERGRRYLEVRAKQRQG
tara:strand:+ start:227 stop:781 length:555 start_codon:yes stop_codon:yes gene_type:complete